MGPKGAPSSDKPPKNIQAIEERLKELREPGLVNDGIRLQWMNSQEKWVPVVWREGVSATPAFGLSALFFATSALPNSVLPGLPPRLARVAFGAAFGTAGAAIHSGDTWNGASIATWWSISHLLLSSITKSVRKEVAKKAGKTLSRTSPFAYVLTSATVATGLAYGITL
ncbi:hypothetical protein CPB86DRAFT_713543 [Serendipita vermifera]|nr:hypothetical protein CPB86DRAFT_713543 [Serendipita vermifera]